MEHLFTLILLLFAAIGAAELAERIAERFLPLLAKEKPLVLWLTGPGAEYKLRRAVRQAKRQKLHGITVVCLDNEAGQICRLIECANPELEFIYGEGICKRCS